MKESIPIFFQIKYMVKDITLTPFGVDNLHLRNEECPPLSGRLPHKCPDLFFFGFGDKEEC